MKVFLKSALVFLGSVLLLIVGSNMSVSNERLSMDTGSALERGRANAVSVLATPIDPANDGKLVHVSGLVSTRGGAIDPLFGFQVSGLRLERRVQMYQWQQSLLARERTAAQKRRGDSGYGYSQVWSDELIDSSQFKEAAEHENPSLMAVNSTSFHAGDAMLGDYQFNSVLIGRLEGAVPVAVPRTLPAERMTEGWSVEGAMFYFSADAARPEIGDLRLSYAELPAGPTTVIGEQAGPVLGSGSGTLLCASGTLSLDELFGVAQRDSSLSAWTWHGIALLIFWFAFALQIRPLRVLFDLLPSHFTGIAANRLLASLAAALLVTAGTLLVPRLNMDFSIEIFVMPALATILLLFGLWRGRSHPSAYNEAS